MAFAFSLVQNEQVLNKPRLRFSACSLIPTAKSDRCRRAALGETRNMIGRPYGAANGLNSLR
jgi:hypothetical protein